jgi:hypothetical protein
MYASWTLIASGCGSGLSCISYKCVLGSSGVGLTQYGQMCTTQALMAQSIKDTQTALTAGGMAGSCTSAAGRVLAPSVGLMAVAMLFAACA